MHEETLNAGKRALKVALFSAFKVADKEIFAFAAKTC